MIYPTDIICPICNKPGTNFHNLGWLHEKDVDAHVCPLGNNWSRDYDGRLLKWNDKTGMEAAWGIYV